MHSGMVRFDTLTTGDEIVEIGSGEVDLPILVLYGADSISVSQTASNSGKRFKYS